MTPIEKILRKHFEFEDRFDEGKFKLALQEILALKPIQALGLINRIAKQRYQWSRDSNEDNEGWLKIADISAEALTEVRRAMGEEDGKG